MAPVAALTAVATPSDGAAGAATAGDLIATARADGPILGAVAATAGATPSPVATESADPTPRLKMATYVVNNVPFTSAVPCGAKTCQVKLDVFVPVGTGSFQTVVLLRGGPSGMGGRSYLGTLAQMLAGEGLLVFNADYRDIYSEGGGYPQAFDDVSCAIRFARAEASRYGGDGARITLAGHSLGGWVGSVVALDPTPFDGDCLAQDGSGRPDAFVGLAGNYDLTAPWNMPDLLTFFGGSAEATAAARAASDPFAYAYGSKIPVRLVAGTNDTAVDPAASTALDIFLLKQGWNVSLTRVPGATHMSLVSAPVAAESTLKILQASELAQSS
jgi:acetyl esterase/lipase